MSKITSYSLIRKNRLIANGTVLFERPGDLDGFLDGAYLHLNSAYPRFYKMDRLGKLGFLSSEVLLTNDIHRYPPLSVALVLSNSHGSLDTDLRYFETTRTFASPSLFVYTLPNIVAGEICIRHKLKGENTFFISPQFDAAAIARYVDLVLAHEQTEACIAGWIDVLHNDAGVFLYLAEKSAENQYPDHTAAHIQDLYQAWNS